MEQVRLFISVISRREDNDDGAIDNDPSIERRDAADKGVAKVTGEGNGVDEQTRREETDHDE